MEVGGHEHGEAPGMELEGLEAEAGMAPGWGSQGFRTSTTTGFPPFRAMCLQ